MKLPLCCNREMRVSGVYERFAELSCGKCGDVLYVKGLAMAMV